MLCCCIALSKDHRIHPASVTYALVGNRNFSASLDWFSISLSCIYGMLRHEKDSYFKNLAPAGCRFPVPAIPHLINLVHLFLCQFLWMSSGYRWIFFPCFSLPKHQGHIKILQGVICFYCLKIYIYVYNSSMGNLLESLHRAACLWGDAELVLLWAK